MERLQEIDKPETLSDPEVQKRFDELVSELSIVSPELHEALTKESFNDKRHNSDDSDERFP